MQSNRVEIIAAFSFGVAGVIVLILLAIIFPNPTPFQYLVFRIVLALAGAGVGAMIPGILNVEIPGIKAGGAIAVFVVVFFWNPARLVVQISMDVTPRGEVAIAADKGEVNERGIKYVV